MDPNPSDEIQSIYLDAEKYDHLYSFGGDVGFYQRQAELHGQPVLELGAGTGRLTLPLVQAGIEVVALERSRAMLDRLEAKAGKAGVTEGLILVCGDMRKLDFSRQFPLIIMPFNAMCHLYTQPDIAQCLQGVHYHLEEEGRFVLDVLRPDLDLLSRNPGIWHPHLDIKDPVSGREISIREKQVYDDASQIRYLKWVYTIDGEERTDQWSMRMFFPQELISYLQFAGFEIEAHWGDFKGEKFHASSITQVLICRKAKS